MKFLSLMFFLFLLTLACRRQGLVQGEEEHEDMVHAGEDYDDEKSALYASAGLTFLLENDLDNETQEISQELADAWTKIQYFELDTQERLHYIKARLELLEEQVELNKEALESTNTITRTCGGFVDLASSTYKKHEIIFRAPVEAPLDDYFSCIWLVWANKGGPVGVRLVYNELAILHESFKLAVADNFTSDGSYSQQLDVNNEDETIFEGPFIAIFFHGVLTERGQGAHIQLWDASGGEDVRSVVEPTIIFFPPLDGNYDNEEREEENLWTELGPQHFKYQLQSRNDSGANENLFIIGNPMVAGALLNATISFIDDGDEKSCTWWTNVAYMDPEEDDLIFSEMRQEGRSEEDIAMTVDDRMPFLINFVSSDQCDLGKGFQLSYQYYYE